MPCKRFVFERWNETNYRTFPPQTISKPVRYRDEHEASCDGKCTPVEYSWFIDDVRDEDEHSDMLRFRFAIDPSLPDDTVIAQTGKETKVFRFES